MCPAQNQVLTQVSYLLVRFAQNFRSVENRDTVPECVEQIKMTVKSRNGVKIAVVPAEDIPRLTGHITAVEPRRDGTANMVQT